MSSSATRPAPTPPTAAAASSPPPTGPGMTAASVAAVGRQRSSRVQSQRVVSSARPVLDAATRAHATAVRLARLEQDNHVEDVTADEAWDGEEEEQVMAGVAAAKGKGKGKGAAKRKREAEQGGKVRKARLTLDEILDRLGMRAEGAEAPNYVTAAARSCPHPARPFCSVCGYRSQYTCVRCGQRYCQIACQRVHQDTRCSRGG